MLVPCIDADAGFDAQIADEDGVHDGAETKMRTNAAKARRSAGVALLQCAVESSGIVNESVAGHACGHRRSVSARLGVVCGGGEQCVQPSRSAQLWFR